MRWPSMRAAALLLILVASTRGARAQCDRPIGPTLSERQALAPRTRALVTVVCPGRLFERATGFAFRDRRTVITDDDFGVGCRRDATVLVPGHPPIRVTRARPHPAGFVALLLDEELPQSVVPLAVPEPFEVDEQTRMFSFSARQPEEWGPGFPSVTDPVFLRGDGEDGDIGAPVLDSEGRLLGVLSEEGAPYADVAAILSAIEDDASEIPTRRNVNWSFNLTPLTILYEPDLGLGLGLDLGLDVAFHDEWTMSASVAGYALGLSDVDDEAFAGFRLMSELRLGYRIVGPELSDSPFVMHLSVGAAAGYEWRPEPEIGGDGEGLFVRPTARLSFHWTLANFTYAIYLDPDDPARSVHMFALGYALEF